MRSNGCRLSLPSNNTTQTHVLFRRSHEVLFIEWKRKKTIQTIHKARHNVYGTPRTLDCIWSSPNNHNSTDHSTAVLVTVLVEDLGVSAASPISDDRGNVHHDQYGTHPVGLEHLLVPDVCNRQYRLDLLNRVVARIQTKIHHR